MRSRTLVRAAGVGMLIGLVAAVWYVATWEVIYFKLRADVGAQYAQVAIDKARATAASPEVIAQKTRKARAVVVTI